MNAFISMCYVSLLLANVNGHDAQANFKTRQNNTSQIESPLYKNVANFYKDILTGYDKRIKPRINQSDSVTVKFLFQFTGIIELDTASQKFSVLGMFYFKWKDEILSWKPSSFGELKAVKFPSKEVWSPTMVLAKAFDGNGVIGNGADIVTYASSGDATWVPEGIYHVICDVTIKHYPFDRQSCNLTLYASDAAPSEVSLEPLLDGVSTELYRHHPEWKLLSVNTYKIEYSGVYLFNIVVELERRTAYIMYTVVSPLISLSVLNIGIFLVPISSGEKGSIAVTIFLSYEVFVSAVSDELPHNSMNVSYLLVYIQLLLIFSVFAVIYTFIQSLVYNYYGEEPVFRCSRTINKHNLTGSTKDNINSHDGLPEKSCDIVSQKVENKAKAKARENEHIFTWTKLLRYIDLVFFFASLIVVSLSTTVYFQIIAQK